LPLFEQNQEKDLFKKYLFNGRRVKIGDLAQSK